MINDNTQKGVDFHGKMRNDPVFLKYCRHEIRRTGVEIRPTMIRMPGDTDEIKMYVITGQFQV